MIMIKTLFFTIVSLILMMSQSVGQTKGITAIEDQKEISGSTKAVIIGVSDYKNVPKLIYAHTDAQLFYNFLTSPAGGKIDPANIKLLLNDKATAGQIFAALDWLVETAKEGDNIIFYFSGHGDLETKTIRQNGFLLAVDAPTASYMSGGTIGVGYLQDYLETLVQQNKAKVLLVTDACRSGKLAGGIEGAKQTTTALQAQWASIIKILSSQSGELSYESKKWGSGGGIFTYYMVNGLQGFADKNHDNKVTLSELNIYLSETVPSETEFKQNPYVAGNLMTTVSRVDSATFTALKSKTKTNETSNDVAMRGSDVLEKKLDSLTLKKYKEFELCIKNDELIYPKPKSSNAWELYQELKENKNASSVINNMKSSLIAALQDKSQQVINLCLTGKINLVRDTVVLDSAYQELYHAFQLIDENYITYTHIKARYLYMKSVRAIDSKEKINLLNECIALEPDAAHPYNYLATVYKNLKDFTNSEKNYSKAIQLAPKWSYPYNNLGILYYDMKEYDKALDNYSAATSINPLDEAAFNNMGNVYLAKKEYIKAIENYNKSIAIKPSFAFPYAGLGIVYYSTSDFDNAEKNYLKAIELNPKFIFAYSNLGNVYREKKDYDKAIECLNKAISLKPNVYSDPYNNLGLVYYIKKEYDLALLNCAKAASIDPKNELAFLNIGNIYKAKNEFVKAIENYNTVLVLNPKSAYACFDLACVFSIQQNKSKAIEYLEKALINKLSVEEVKTISDFDNIKDSKEYNDLLLKYGK